MSVLGKGSEPSVDAWALLETENWDALDEDHRMAVLDHCRHYQAVFDGDEQGRYVLADLVREFKETEIAKPGDKPLDIGIRQGAANVVRRIELMIKISQRGAV